MDPKCQNRQGGEDCWGEWLKEVQPTSFQPVARGQLGPGPWSTAEMTQLGGQEGLGDNIVGVGVDTAQNIYAVSDSTFYVRRAGAARFEAYQRNSNGLRDYTMLSVAGGGPGVAYVGYEGVFGPGDPDVDPDPPEVRKSGDVQEIHLQPSGFTATTWDTHNSNVPISGKYDHSRSMYEIFVPKRGPAAGEVFLGTEHGIVRYQGSLYADHRHIATDVSNGNGTTSQRFGASKAMTVTDDGTVWYGNDFRFGGVPWTPRLYEWYFDAPWLFPSYGFGGETDRDYNEGIGVDSKGDVWVGARTLGMVHLIMAPNKHSAKKEKLDVPSAMINDLVVDLNDTLWLATDAGAYRYDPVTKKWTRFAAVSSGVNKLYLDDTVSPRALYFATGNGITVYRGQ
jgi:hypothetical protein